jgi:hypothetical protein
MPLVLVLYLKLSLQITDFCLTNEIKCLFKFHYLTKCFVVFYDVVEETKESSSIIGIGIGKKLVSGVKQKKTTHHFILFNDMLAIVDQALGVDPGVVLTKVRFVPFLFSYLSLFSLPHQHLIIILYVLL